MRYAVGGADSRRPVKARERLRDADGSAGVGSGFKKACGVGMGAWGVAAAVEGARRTFPPQPCEVETGSMTEFLEWSRILANCITVMLSEIFSPLK